MQPPPPDPHAGGGYARRRSSFANGYGHQSLTAHLGATQPIPESYSYEQVLSLDQVDFDDLYPRPQSPSEIRKFLQVRTPNTHGQTVDIAHAQQRSARPDARCPGRIGGA
eukprot:2472657-Rhodomonas_salina.1